MRKIEMIGRRFGRLVVLEEIPAKTKRGRYRCQCDCGKTTETMGSDLRANKATSCGCGRIEKTKVANTRHGLRHTPEYEVWATIKARCTNPKSPGYKDYGGRGIKLHPAWHDFKNFIRYIGPRPSAVHSIDRKKNDQGYVPGNVRWATSAEQSRNKRNNRWLTLNGETRILADWAEEYGIDQEKLRRRLKRGWELERALTDP